MVARSQAESARGSHKDEGYISSNTSVHLCERGRRGGGERTTLAFQSHKEAADIQLRGTNRSHADRDAPSTAGKQAGKRNTPIKCATSQYAQRKPGKRPIRFGLRSGRVSPARPARQ